MLDKNIEAFVIYVALLSLMHLAKKAQIALLLIKNVKILSKYSEFLNVFSKKKALYYQS